MALMDDDNHDEAGLSGLVRIGSAGLPLRTMFATTSENRDLIPSDGTIRTDRRS
jgi:hypothetical protein